MPLSRVVGFLGALVNKIADQTTLDATTAVALAWDAEVYDEGGWHDNVTANTRLTVPAGVTRVRLSGQVRFSLGSATGSSTLAINKNGAAMSPGYVQVSLITGQTTGGLNITSDVVTVVAGDYFELMFGHTVDNSITLSGTVTGCHFGIQSVV